MPNRILREGINGSERIAKLKWPDEVFYRRLMSVVDDYGRTDANPQLLRSRCYPLQTDDVRNTDISRWLLACQTAGLLLVYTIESKQYLQVLDFRQQIRSVSKFPAPPNAQQVQADASINAANAHLGVSVFGVVSEGGVEGVTPCSPPGGGEVGPLAFDQFWNAYPLKVGKGAAKTSFDRKKGALILQEILAAIARQKLSQDWTKEDAPPDTEQKFISRRHLAKRWDVSVDTIKRRERAGKLTPRRDIGDGVRYAMVEVLAIEECSQQTQ